MTLKTRWGKVKVLANDHQNGPVSIDFASAMPTEEFLQRILFDPSLHHYASLNQWLKVCPIDWLKQFLDGNGIRLMFAALSYMSMKGNARFADAVVELEIIRSIKCVINSVVGMEYLIKTDGNLVQLMVLCKYSTINCFPPSRYATCKKSYLL